MKVVSQILSVKKIRNLIRIGSLLLAIAALSACYPASVAPGATAQPAVTTAGPIATVMPAIVTAVATAKSPVVVQNATTAATVTPATAAPAAHQAAAAGIRFAYPASLAQGDQAATVAAEPAGSDAPWWQAVPAHPEVSLTGYVLPNTLHTPRIAVYPVAEFAALSPEAARRIEGLRQLLKEKPAAPASELPFLPPFNAVQQMHAGVQYLSFADGQGVRYLTQYAQGLMPINNRELIYTFQGLTDDGKFYVAAILPVSHNLLPADVETMAQSEREAMEANYLKYMENITKTLGEQSAASFKPTMSDLDEAVKSLDVTP